MDMIDWMGASVWRLASVGRGVAMKNKPVGSSLEDFLAKEGIFKETQAQAVKEVIAWQRASAAKKQKTSKMSMDDVLARTWERGSERRQRPLQSYAFERLLKPTSIAITSGGTQNVGSQRGQIGNSGLFVLAPTPSV
jgi:hypothetical protein